MGRESFPHLQPGCPWYELSEMRIPNVKWCEPQQCSWVVEPANTWSNLGYIIVGLLLLNAAKNSKSKILKFFGPAALIVGFSSFVYHMSYTFAFQIFDFLGMYVFCYMLLALNGTRLGAIKKTQQMKLLWAATFVTTIATVVADFANIPIQALVFVLILIIATSEFVIHARNKNYSLKYFGMAMSSMIVAATFSFLDVSRIWCHPENKVLHGHAIWHMFGALALGLLFLHYRQFESEI